MLTRKDLKISTEGVSLLREIVEEDEGCGGSST